MRCKRLESGSLRFFRHGGAPPRGMRLLGVEFGDEVFCSTFTFVATANPIVYQGARPVFIDSEERSWNMDPNLLSTALADRAESGRLPRAIVVADIYGQCAGLE